MEESILLSTKKVLGLAPEDDSFDLDIITHTNSAFSTLNDLGVGPDEGFVVDDEATVWSSFTDNDKLLGHVKTYVYLQVRLLFDSPTTAHMIAAMERQIEQHMFRINMEHEKTVTPPTSTEEDDE